MRHRRSHHRMPLRPGARRASRAGRGYRARVLPKASSSRRRTASNAFGRGRYRRLRQDRHADARRAGLKNATAIDAGTLAAAALALQAGILAHSPIIKAARASVLVRLEGGVTEIAGSGLGGQAGHERRSRSMAWVWAKMSIPQGGDTATLVRRDRKRARWIEFDDADRCRQCRQRIAQCRIDIELLSGDRACGAESRPRRQHRPLVLECPP